MLIAILSFLFFVFVHEFGHFIAAKYYGVPVLTFSVGFGPRLWKRRIGNTVYAIGLLPLGGYVRFKLSIKEKELSKENKGTWFAPLSTEEHELLVEFKKGVLSDDLKFNLKRDVMTLLAGPLMNFFLAYIAFFIFVTGIASEPEDVDYTMLRIELDSPSYKAGLRTGDMAITVNNRPVRYYRQLWQEIYSSGKASVDIGVRRAGHQDILHFDVTPNKVVPDENFKWHYDHGIRTHKTSRSVNIYDSFWLAWSVLGEQISDMMSAIIYSNSDRLTKKFENKRIGPRDKEYLEDQYGVSGLFSMLAEALSTRLDVYLYLCAHFNVILAIFNLLPLPALDGGQIVCAFLHYLCPQVVTVGRVKYVSMAALSLLLVYSFILLMGESVYLWTIYIS